MSLVVEGVSHSFPRIAALRDVDLRVDPGSVHCLLGPSGSGKTTLLRLIAGLELLQHGRIVVGDSVVGGPGVRVGPERRSVGLVFQEYALFPHLDVSGNVSFGMARDVDRGAEVARLLAQVELAGFERAMPHTLSGGQQQRVALARALAREPRVMLLDEPFSGLDARLRQEVRRLALAVLRSRGVATLMVTHDPHEALASADAISVIRDGSIVQSGDAEQVYREPADRRTAEMFGPINEIGGRFVRPESIRLSGSPAPGTAEGTIRERIPQGSVVRLVIEMRDGTVVEACEFSESPRRPGDTVYL